MEQVAYPLAHAKSSLESIPSLPLNGQLSAGCDALRLLLADTRSEATKRAYQGDLKHFFTACGLVDVGAALEPPDVGKLFGLSAGAMALMLNEYKASMLGAKLSEATINRRLSAVRSLLRMARRLGADVPDPAALVSSEKVSTYRDTRGPAVSDVIRLLAAPDRSTIQGKRDYALLVLLAENALRRAEVCSLSVGDFDAGERRLHIIGKGKGTQRQPVTLSMTATAALLDYLAARRDPAAVRQDAPAQLAADMPLFTNTARRETTNGGRLTADGLYHILQGYGARVLGRELHPHSLRHAAITAALDATGGDVRRAQRLSRHADVRTLQRYDDNRADLQGEVTGLLSALYNA